MVAVLRGTAQDITKQRNLQQELERLIRKRTEELAATNKMLTSTNEELLEANTNLRRSNEELGQYAYVASHDLQEPLRKIRTFSDRLNTIGGLAPESKKWLDKIHQSSERMALLIRNLLEFSRLIKSDELVTSVDLSQVISNVLNDFELVIEEKSAVVEVARLPVVNAIGLQMNQLFYNLLGNALKFTVAGRVPVITIESRVSTAKEVSDFISDPRSSSNYYQLSIQDNGIGFDSQYAEHIFEIFKRLHASNEYQGSGIGLALCKRIVTNHNGYIAAVSEKDKGSVFHVFLPAGISNL